MGNLLQLFIAFAETFFAFIRSTRGENRLSRVYPASLRELMIYLAHTSKHTFERGAPSSKRTEFREFIENESSDIDLERLKQQFCVHRFIHPSSRESFLPEEMRKAVPVRGGGMFERRRWVQQKQRRKFARRIDSLTYQTSFVDQFTKFKDYLADEGCTCYSRETEKSKKHFPSTEI